MVLNNSIAYNGGALYINLINDSSITIIDSSFNNSFAKSENSLAKGGAIFVSLLKSTNL
jgi:hypothetical protein